MTDTSHSLRTTAVRHQSSKYKHCCRFPLEIAPHLRRSEPRLYGGGRVQSPRTRGRLCATLKVSVAVSLPDFGSYVLVSFRIHSSRDVYVCGAHVPCFKVSRKDYAYVLRDSCV